MKGKQFLSSYACQFYWINNWDINSSADIHYCFLLIWCKFESSLWDVSNKFVIPLILIWRVWFTYWYIIINRIQNRSWVHMNVITAVSNQEEIIVLVEVLVNSPAEEGIGLATTGQTISPIRDVASKQFQFIKILKLILFHLTFCINFHTFSVANWT